MTTICTTFESVSRAVQRLLRSEYVILDCEGRKIGFESGKLSLITIGTPHAKNIYLFDLFALNWDALHLLFDSVLSPGPSSRAMTKVVWDGRLDYLELLHHYNCRLENVLDLQLVDVHSRFQRDANQPENRIFRFSRDDFPVKEVRKYQVGGIHFLSSFDFALAEHRVRRVRTRAESLEYLSAHNASELRARHLLRRRLFEFSVDEIKRIAKLYDHFQQSGYLKHMEYLRNKQMEYLRDLGARYSAMQRQIACKPEDIDIFSKGPYLPLSIRLEAEPEKEERSESNSQSSRECTQCRRMIPEHGFPFERHPKANKDRRPMARTSVCKVCTLLLGKLQYAEKQAQDEDATETESTASKPGAASDRTGRSSRNGKLEDVEGKTREILEMMMK